MDGGDGNEEARRDAKGARAWPIRSEAGTPRGDQHKRRQVPNNSSVSVHTGQGCGIQLFELLGLLVSRKQQSALFVEV